MLCVDCTETIPDGALRCIYCQARRRASITRKIGGLIFAAFLILTAIAFAIHSIALAAHVMLLFPAAIMVYILGVIRWLRAPKRPY